MLEDRQILQSKMEAWEEAWEWGTEGLWGTVGTSGSNDTGPGGFRSRVVWRHRALSSRIIMRRWPLSLPKTWSPKAPREVRSMSMRKNRIGAWQLEHDSSGKPRQDTMSPAMAGLTGLQALVRTDTKTLMHRNTVTSEHVLNVARVWVTK